MKGLSGLVGPGSRRLPGGGDALPQPLPALGQLFQLGLQDPLLLGPQLLQLPGELLLDGVELGQAAADLDGAADGEDDVGQIEDQEDRRQGHGDPQVKEPQDPAVYDGGQPVTQRHAGQAKERAVEQAHPAPQVAEAVGVVPPAHVEQLLHGPAGDVLQCGGKQTTQEKGQHGAAAPAPEDQEHQQGAVAVDGAEGAVEKAPLFAQPPVGQGTVDHLAAPAQEAV